MMGARQWDTPQSIISSTSSGAMLRGVLHTDINDVNVYNVSRGQLVEVPDNMQILGPTLDLRTERTVIHNKQQLRAFEQSIRNTEISLGANLQFMGLFEIGGNFGQHKNVEQNDESRRQYKFYSEVESTFFAVARAQLDPNRLKLSSSALSALYKIHLQIDATTQWKENDKRRHLYNLCKIFFENFGSHINCGVFHFGGIITKTSTFDGITDKSLQTIKKVVQAGLRAHAGAVYSGINVSMSVARMRSDGRITEKFATDLEQKTKVICHQYGGLPITNEFSKGNWKTKLGEQSSKWVVIDRGDSQVRDHVGVWDLLPGNGFDGKRKRLHDTLYDFFNTYLYRLRIYKLIGVGQGRTEIAYALRAIADLTKGRRETNGVVDDWLQLLEDDKNVANFLLKPGQYLLNPNLPHGALDEIAHALEELLDLVGGNTFATKEQICALKNNILKRTKER